jgi:predicted flap endonuclease-1-like 5' DNA nuclease
MIAYLPIIISGILIFTALMWWMLALGNVKKDASISDYAPPEAVPAPPVAAAAPPAAPKVAPPAKLMDDSKPASKTAPPKAQAPVKAAATKAATKVAPTKTAKPVAKKPVAPKASAPKFAVAKVAAPKPAAKPKVDDAAKAKAAPKVVTAPKAIPKPKAAPKPKAVAKPVIPDNLELLKGVGPKLNTLLKSLGVTSFDQVANWSPADITEIDAKLGTFAGRIGRDNWIDQAKLLVAGDVAGFEKKYGALGSEVKKG